jgi:hypothetical protein
MGVNTPDAGRPGPDGRALAGVREEATELGAVSRMLHEEFDERLDPADVDECLHRVAERFVDARIRTYVPLLVRRYAREELRERATLIGPVSPPPSAPVALPTQRGRSSAGRTRGGRPALAD